MDGWMVGGRDLGQGIPNSCLTSASHDNADGVRPFHDRFICFDVCEACDSAGGKWKEVSDFPKILCTNISSMNNCGNTK